MSDDIVTRLREGHGQGCECYAHCYCECGCDAIWAGHYTREAADEIERLRAEVKRWSNWASDYAYDDETCECDRCEQVRAAWNAKQ